MSKDITYAVPKLRIFAVLDEDKLSDEFKAFTAKLEGNYEAVDIERPRDLGWTEEITEATTGYLLVDEDGSTVAKFSDLEKALAARASAKISFSVELNESKGK